jgi:hypothetical protein
MNDWINGLANEYAPYENTAVDGKVQHTKLSILLASTDVDISKIHEILIKNQIPVLEIRIEQTSDEQLPPIEAGMRVCTKEAMSLGNNICIKTPATLYTVASAILPAGYVGDVLDVAENAATVKFGANIRVSAVDRSGYTDAVDYFVDTLTIPVKDLKILE